MPHKGKYYELAFRRDFRMQQNRNYFGFPLRFLLEYSGFGGVVGAAINFALWPCEDGSFDDVDENLHWESVSIPIGPDSWTLKIEIKIDAAQNNLVRHLIVGDTIGLVYRSDYLPVTGGPPQQLNQPYPHSFAKPPWFTDSSFGRISIAPDYY